MTLSANDFSGWTTFITGPEKGCGKTTFLNYALGLLRAEGERPAFLGIGFDGEALPATRAAGPRIPVLAGEVFASAERYIRLSDCAPEILEALPGFSALGRLALARARRDGEVVLVGPERNEYAAWAIAAILQERWAGSVLVDGAMNRITQIASFSGSRFFFALRLSPGGLDRGARAMRVLHALASLPAIASAGPERAAAGPAGAPLGHGAALDEAVAAAGLPGPACELEGPLTAETLARVPAAARTVVVSDLTKVFLDASALSALRRERSLAVREAVDFGGFAVALRDLPPERLREALGDEAIWERVALNPYEAGRGPAGAGDGE